MDGQWLAASSPNFDLLYVVAVGWRVLHLLAAAALVGGLLFLKQVVAPVAKEAVAEGTGNLEEVIYRGQRAKWSRIVMFATLALLASGFHNYMALVSASEKLPGLYHGLFFAKFLLAMFVFFVAAATAGRSAVADRLRRDFARWLNLCLVAIVAIVVLAAMLRSFEKIPRPAAEEMARLSDESRSTCHG